MTDDRKYNGWANYETWCVNLWIGNEQGSYEYWRERAAEFWKDATGIKHMTWTRSEEARFTLADALKAEITEGMPITEGMYCDLLGAALCEVDWNEIANSMLEEMEGYEDAA